LPKGKLNKIESEINMAKGNGGTAIAIIISVILSAGLGVGAYFGLPYLFPGMGTPAYLYQEFDSQIIVYDSETTWTEISGINVNFTKEHDSRIEASFDSVIMLGIQTNERYAWEFALSIQGAGNRTTYVGYYDTNFVSSFIEITNSFHIMYLSNVLPAGTYKVSLWGRSLIDTSAPGYAIINVPLLNYTTSLAVQEIL
jgi:hypothetical protein